MNDRRVLAEIRTTPTVADKLVRDLPDWLRAYKVAAPNGSDPRCYTPLDPHCWSVWQQQLPPLQAKPRSPQWEALRNRAIAMQPWCSCCGSAHNLVVHRIRPFHLSPELELDPRNWIVLCEGALGWLSGTNCHFVWGHFGDWTKYNAVVYNGVTAYQRLLAAAYGREYRKPLFPAYKPEYPWSD